MFDLPPPNPGFEIVVASRGMSKGLAQTDGIQFVPKAFLQFGAVQIGGQWKNVTSTAAEGEAAAFANVTRKLAGFQFTVGAAYKFQTGVHGNPDSDSFEFSGGATRKFGNLGARASIIYSPDDLGSAKRSVYLEGGPTLDVGKYVKLSANLGRRERVGSPDYTSFNAGVGVSPVKNLTIEARYYDTAQSELGETFDDRVVFSARLSF